MEFFYTLSGSLPSQLPVQAPSPKGSQAKPRSLVTQAYNRNLQRQKESIEEWRRAMERAEANFQPLRYDLIRIFNEIVLDAHITGILRQRLSKVLSRKLVLHVGDADPQPIAMAKWLRDFIRYSWEARMYGYSPIELGDVLPDKSGLTWVRLRERHMVSPDARMWLTHPQVLSGISLDDPAYAPWYVLVQDSGLGELNPCVPIALSKRFVFSGWTEFAQVFGLPIIVGTEAQDAPKAGDTGTGNKTEMEVSIADLGLGGSITLSSGQKVELLQPHSTDAYKVFAEHFDTANRELSKIVLGQTMTTEDGSSRSQAEVHERVSDDITADDLAFIDGVLNGELYPRLVALGIWPKGGMVSFEAPERISLMEKKDVIATLGQVGLRVTKEWAEENFGIELQEPVEIPTEPPGKPEPPGAAPASGAELEARLTHTEIEDEYTIHSAIVAAYRPCQVCGGHTDAVADLEAAQEVFDDAYLENLLRRFHGQTFTEDNLPEDLYRKTAAWLFGGVGKGTGRMVSPDFVASDELSEQLRRNVFRFSAAKTYQQAKAYSSLLIGDDGQVREWEDFKKRALGIARDYNRNWLRSEYDTAVLTARSAANWQRYQREKDTLPFATYRAVMDAVTRKTHAALDGITLPLDHPLWDTHWPPIAWRCRCDTDQEGPDATPTAQDRIDNLPTNIVDPVFAFNAGKEGQVFSEGRHPYFQVPQKARRRKENNFGLPIPGVPVATAPVNEGWPAFNQLTLAERLGGSTGALKMKGPDGQFYVLKRGASPEHLAEEMLADDLYRKMGIPVPDSVAIETPTGKAKLAKWVEGTEYGKLSGDAQEAANRQLQKHFAADALLGNWDVIGMEGGNVLVDAKGKVWRIDNGGALRFRAQGARKTASEWDKYPSELWTMRDASVQAATAEAFAGLDFYALAKQAVGLNKSAQAAIADLADKELAATLSARLEQMQDIASTAQTWKKDGWISAYTDEVMKHKIGIRKAGISDKLPAELLPRRGFRNFKLYDENGKFYDNLRGMESITADVEDYIRSVGGNYEKLPEFADSWRINSNQNIGMAYKEYLRRQINAPYDDFFWHGCPESSAVDFYLKDFGNKANRTTFAAYHAYTHEQLTRIKLPNVGKKSVRLLRSEVADVMKTYGIELGQTGTMTRAVASSTSLISDVYVDKATCQTVQLVPLSRITMTYLGGRSRRVDTMFLEDFETEFIALLNGLKTKFIRTKP